MDRRGPFLEENSRPSQLPRVPAHVDSTAFWPRVVMLCVFAVHGMVRVRQDFRDGEIANAFLHWPLRVFHEAGLVVFAFLGHGMAVAGGTLGQLLMPLILG